MRGKRIIKWSKIIIILAVLLILSAIISLTFGSVDIPPDVVFKIILNRLFNIENDYSKNWTGFGGGHD